MMSAKRQSLSQDSLMGMWFVLIAEVIIVRKEQTVVSAARIVERTSLAL